MSFISPQSHLADGETDLFTIITMKHARKKKKERYFAREKCLIFVDTHSFHSKWYRLVNAYRQLVVILNQAMIMLKRQRVKLG